MIRALRALCLGLVGLTGGLLGVASCSSGGGGGGLAPDGGAAAGGTGGSAGAGGSSGADAGPDCTSTGCPSGETCFQGQCVPECNGTPDCSGRECGPDPVCGYPCGTCALGACTIAGKCECATSCAAVGATCGTVSDGCGGTLDCGGCFSNMTCTANVCVVPGCSGEWTDGVIETPGDLGSGGGLLVDAQGTAHAAWNAGARYAKRTPGGSWQTEPTQSGGWNAALAVDPSGGVHLSRFDSGTQEISVSSRAAGSTTWTASVVDTAGGGQYQDTTSIAADQQGGLHVRYLSQGSLKYAHRAPGSVSWVAETAATPAYASGSTAHASSSLAVDAQGGVHVAYFANHDALWYAYRAPGGGWSSESVDSAASLINAPPYLALDAQGGVHVGYLGALARSVRHAHKPAGGSWSTRTLVTKVEQIFGPSMAVSDVGSVHFTYQHEGTLHYFQAPPSGTTLDFQNVLATGLKISEPSRVALDSAGGVHVIYEKAGAMRSAYRCPGPCPAKSCSELGANCGEVFDGCKYVDCGSCSDPTLCGAGGVPNQCCTPTTCAAEGKQCGSISDGCGSLIDCGSCSPTQSCGSQSANLCGPCTPGTWAPATVSSLGNVGWPTAIAVDGQGQPHLLFGDDTNGDLVYAGFVQGAGWQTSLVDALSGAFYKPFGISLASDAQGALHAAYSVLLSTGTTVRYAHRAAGGSTWTTTDVATGLSKTTTPVLKRDAQGGLHLAYHDGTANALVYASRAASGGAWSKQTIASGGSDTSASERISLTLDAAGTVHVSYSVTDFGASAIMYAKRSGGTFSSETAVPAAGDVDRQSSIGVDSTGRVHIAFSQQQDLRYATKPVAGVWSAVMITSADYTEPTLMIDAQDGVHIVFNADGSADDLRYAYKPASGGWSTSNADSQGDVGKSPSAAMASNGGIHAAYVDFANKDLKYAFRCPN